MALGFGLAHAAAAVGVAAAWTLMIEPVLTFVPHGAEWSVGALVKQVAWCSPGVPGGPGLPAAVGVTVALTAVVVLVATALLGWRTRRS
jgi:hypothetical protein